MTAQKSIINVFLDDFQASTCHVRLSNGLNLLQTVLIAIRIEGVVDAIEELDNLFAFICLGELVKSINVDKDDSDLTLRLREILLTILDLGAHKSRYQYVDN